MRILIVIPRNIKRNSYAEFLFQLVIDLFASQNYQIHEATGFSKANQRLSGENVMVVVRLNRKTLSLLQKIRISFFVRKHNIKWLVTMADQPKLLSEIPQLIIPLDTNTFSNKKKLSSSANMAVCSQSEKQNLIEKYQLLTNNTQVIQAAADDVFQPVSWSEQQSVKMQHAQGREYFLITAEHKTLVSLLLLLKAFSGFKKWQHSSMKLIVAGTVLFAGQEEWQEKINTYKYRDDIVFLNALTSRQYASVLAAAYAFVHTPDQNNDLMPLLQAIQCGAPAISFTTENIKEYFEEVVVLVATGNYDELKNKMILLYKDETLRSKLIESGFEKAKQYTKAEASSQLQDVIPKALSYKKI